MTDVTVRGGVVVATRGAVDDGDREHVRARVAAVVPVAVPGPLLTVRIKLAVLPADLPRPALGQASLAVAWRLVRAIVAAPQVVDLGARLADRLTAQLRAATTGVPRRWPDPHRRHRPDPTRLPGVRGSIVRHKQYRLARSTPGQAAQRMDALDHDFHLYIDADTGQDAVVYRVGPTGYRLARQVSQAPPAPPATVRLTVNVFFTDTATRRGIVLYRRFDGHYGLLGPADERGEHPPIRDADRGVGERATARPA